MKTTLIKKHPSARISVGRHHFIGNYHVIRGYHSRRIDKRMENIIKRRHMRYFVLALFVALVVMISIVVMSLVINNFFIL